MKKIKCLIVDDESMARKGLESYAEQIDFLEVVDLCKNAMQANKILHQQAIDLLFLDINMPQLSGLDLLKSLSNPPFVIFTTAYSEYVMESFNFDVIDYLVKPIPFDRFLQAVNKAHRLINPSHESNSDNYFFVKTSHKLVKVFIKDIQYIESAQNYVQIHTTTERHMALIPLKSVIELLPPNQFIQINRGCVVAMDKIQAIDGNQLDLGDTQLLVSRRMKEEVFEVLLKNKIIKK